MCSRRYSWPRKKILAPSRTKATVSADIPDLFFGFPQAAPTPAPVASVVPPLPKPPEQKPQDTNYFDWSDKGETPKSDETGLCRGPTAQTDFMSRLAHPKDVVARAAALSGVAGAVVAMQDGLRVASQAPADLNADTLAAFLPQIFERVNQCTRELRMGVLNNVNFTRGERAVENIPGQRPVFRRVRPGRGTSALGATGAAGGGTGPQEKEIIFMAIINQATKELQVKIVYYGPAMGGKTTNLVQVHDHVQTAAGNKGKLVSLATSSDRTLFFDFLPIEAMTIKGFKTKFQLYTVPGQVIYNTTRQLVLRGVDGLVFVADSQYEKMPENVESFQNLVDNLNSLKIHLAEVPYVLQYNKRDLPNAAPMEYMDFLLNNRDVQVPSFGGTAHKCEGVFESLNMITRMLLQKFINQSVPQYA